MSRKKGSAEKESFWRLAMEEFRTSGLSVRAFCAREGLSEPSFYAWRRKLQQRDTQRPAASGPSELVPVKIIKAVDCEASDLSASPPLELITPTGFSLRFPANLPPRELTAVLQAIDGVDRC